MTRREFMKSSGAALAAALAAPAARSREATNGVRLGLTTYQIGSRWTISELIEFLPRSEAVFARVGIDPEISNHRRRDRIEREAGHDCFESCA